MADQYRVVEEVAEAIAFIDEDQGIEEYRLSNGMKLLLVRQPVAPVVAVMVLYHVGSRNEAVGYTGATHLLEHMMFKGTPTFHTERGSQIGAVLKRLGAHFNATTWYDRTNYFEAVPKEHLELVVQLEADRMRNSLIRDEDRESERIVVRNELERGENEPLRVLDIQAWATAFREHSYHHPTIGWRCDVENVPTEQLREFYHTFYWPNNTTTIIVGDFERERTLSLVADYFGRIPRSPHRIPEVYTVEPPQEGERRFKLHRAGEVGIVQACYHTPEARHPDIFPLVLLARILTDGVTTRLYQRLVDAGLAINVHAQVTQLRDPGLFEIVAVLRPGVEHQQAEKVILEELEVLKNQTIPEAELERAKRKVEADIFFDRDGALNFACALAEAESSADWRWFLSYVPNVQRVEIEDIQRVVNQSFQEDNSTIGWFVPKGSATPAEEFMEEGRFGAE
ncbi:MAG: insulinase family protein [Acidobacteria bacterium]|nr:insulinase family protein [Acidobacteriota bacterium]